ncbi:MAG: hypothetical protein LKE89_06715 [Lactobacillaceae bacterium]|jgi:hypothetical protein|nr:hypothetical protein [Lactobacillaceae bacterium]
MSFEFKKFWRSHLLLVLLVLTIVFAAGNFYLQHERQVAQRQHLQQQIEQELLNLSSCAKQLEDFEALEPNQNLITVRQQIIQTTFADLVIEREALKNRQGQKFIQAELKKRQDYRRLNQKLQHAPTRNDFASRINYPPAILTVMGQQQFVFDDLQVTTLTGGAWLKFTQHFFHPLVLLLSSLLLTAIFSSEIAGSQKQFMVMTARGGWRYAGTSYLTALTIGASCYMVGSLSTLLLSWWAGSGLVKNSTDSWQMPLQATTKQTLQLGQGLGLAIILGGLLAANLLWTLFVLLTVSQNLTISFAGATVMAGGCLSFNYLLPTKFGLTSYLNLFTQLPKFSGLLISSLISLILIDFALLIWQRWYQQKWTVS